MNHSTLLVGFLSLLSVVAVLALVLHFTKKDKPLAPSSPSAPSCPSGQAMKCAPDTRQLGSKKGHNVPVYL